MATLGKFDFHTDVVREEVIRIDLSSYAVEEGTQLVKVILMTRSGRHKTVTLTPEAFVYGDERY